MTEKAIQVDTRQKLGKHDEKHDGLERMGYTLFRSKLAFGDYAKLPTVVVDSKADIYELAMDIDQEHDRFRAELVGARDLGVKMVVLVENKDGVRDLGGLAAWREDDRHFKMRKRKSGNARVRRIDGARLSKACATMERKYGAKFDFCAPHESAARIAAWLDEGGGDES